MSFPSIVFGIFCLVFSIVLATIEDVYLFLKSHYDWRRGSEIVDNFIGLAGFHGFKLLYSTIVFFAFLKLWTWYNMPLKHSSRHNLEAERDAALNRIHNIEAERDDALNKIQQLLARISEHDNSLLATENIILKNKIAWSETQSMNLGAKRLELERTLQRSKLLRLDVEAERIRLSSEARRAKTELVDVKAKLMLKVESLKEDHREAMDLVKQRDKAIAILSTNSDQLHKELEGLTKAKDAAHKDRESSELKNARAEIARLQSVTAWMDAKRATLCEQHHARLKAQQGYNEGLLKVKDAELERGNAQRLKEREAQSIKACKMAEEGEVARQEVERHRDELVKAVGQLYRQMSRMEEVDLMEGVESESGNSRKRHSDEDENPRPAKMPRIEWSGAQLKAQQGYNESLLKAKMPNLSASMCQETGLRQWN